MTHFWTLGVSPDAPAPELAERHAALTAQLELDRQAGLPAAADDRKLVDEAFRVLSDPELRAEYEAALADVELCPRCWIEVGDAVTCPACGAQVIEEVVEVVPDPPTPDAPPPPPDLPPPWAEPAPEPVATGFDPYRSFGVYVGLAVMLFIAVFTPTISDLGLEDSLREAHTVTNQAEAEAVTQELAGGLGRLLPWIAAQIVVLAYVGRRVFRHGTRDERWLTLGGMAVIACVSVLLGPTTGPAVPKSAMVTFVPIGVAIQAGIAWLLGALVDLVVGKPRRVTQQQRVVPGYVARTA